MSLDWHPKAFRQLLGEASEMVAELYDDLESKKVMQATNPKQVQDLFQDTMPTRGSEPSQLLQEVQQTFFDQATLSMGPHFFAYVLSGGTQMGILAELFTAALNQNCGKWHLSPPGVELEQLVVKWIARFIGYREDAAGVLLSGGSNANLHCLTVAHRVMAPWDVVNEGNAGKPQMVAYTSEEGHFCLDKSMDLLGLGRNALRKIPVGPDKTIDLTFLEASIREDRALGLLPFCVIGNAGTVNTGAVDPMDALADLCQEYNLWLHVDGAYGSVAATLPQKRELFLGMKRADSIAVDPHKWLYVPFEAGCALIRSRQELHQAFRLQPSYLATDKGTTDRFDPHQHGFQLSRSLKSLKVWMTFKAYGADRLRQEIHANIEAVDYLAEQVRLSKDFEILAPHPLSILCFRYLGEEPSSSEAVYNALNQRLLDAVERDGRVFITGTVINGKQCLRVCLVNHRSSKRDMDHLLGTLRHLGVGLAEPATA